MSTVLCKWQQRWYIAESEDWSRGCDLNAGDRPEAEKLGFREVKRYGWSREQPADPEAVFDTRVNRWHHLVRKEWKCRVDDLSEIAFFPTALYRGIHADVLRWAPNAEALSVVVEFRALASPAALKTNQMTQRGISAVDATERVRDLWTDWHRTMEELMARGGWIVDRRDGFYHGTLRLDELEVLEGPPPSK